MTNYWRDRQALRRRSRSRLLRRRRRASRRFRLIGRRQRRTGSGLFRPRRETAFQRQVGRWSIRPQEAAVGTNQAGWRTGRAVTTFGGRGRPKAGGAGRELAQSFRPNRQAVDSKGLIVRVVAVRSCIQYAG